MKIEFDELWNYNDPKATEEKFISIRDEVKNENDLSKYIQFLTQLARTQGLQQKFDEAHKILDEAEKLLDELDSEKEVAEVRYLLERGRTYNSSGEIEKAKELFIKAFEISKNSGLDFFTIDAAHMMGIAEAGDESLRWSNIAIRLIEDTQDEHSKRWLGSLYNNTGWTYHDMGEYDKALELFEKNVKWHEEKKSKQPLIIAKWCVGRTLRSLEKTDEALEIQQNLLKEVSENNLEEDGFIYEEIGECLLSKDNNEVAKSYFAKAHELLSQDIWLQKNETARLQRIYSLSI